MMFQRRIKGLRKQAGLSQKALAEKLFISQQSVGKWESGLSKPTPDALSNLANLFDVTTDYLLGISDDPKGSLNVALTDTDPQLSAIAEKAKQLNAQGLTRLEQYVDDLLAADIYRKKKAPLAIAARGGNVVQPDHPIDVDALDRGLSGIATTDNL